MKRLILAAVFSGVFALASLGAAEPEAKATAVEQDEPRFLFYCEHCGKLLRAQVRHSSQGTECPGCEKRITIPEPPPVNWQQAVIWPRYQPVAKAAKAAKRVTTAPARIFRRRC